jgi:hypothetical protein
MERFLIYQTMTPVRINRNQAKEIEAVRISKTLRI